MKCDDWHGCPIRFALGLFGDKWSLLVIRDLMFKNKKYFNEFQDSDEGISTNMLSDRLQRLEKAGIIKSHSDPEHKSKKIYKLTDKGIDLAPVMLSIIDWSETYDEATEVPPAFISAFRKSRSAFTNTLKKQLAKGKAPKVGG